MNTNGWGLGLLLFIAAICILGWLYAPTPIKPNVQQDRPTDVAQDTVTLYRASVNIPKETFTEQYEIAIVYTYDGVVFFYSSHEEETIRLNAISLTADMKKFGYAVEDIILIMHNHWRPGDFSGPDIMFYKALALGGFKGVFALYHQSTGKVEVYKGDD